MSESAESKAIASPIDVDNHASSSSSTTNIRTSGVAERTRQSFDGGNGGSHELKAGGGGRGVLRRVADLIVPGSVPSTAGVGATLAMGPLHGSASAGDGRAHASTQEEVEEQGVQGQDDLLGEVGSGYTPYLGRLTAVACLGGLQFGWDTGIASGMLVAIHQDLGHTLSAVEQEVIVSATTVGAIIGALSAGRLSDWIGRKRVMVIAGIFFALGSVEQAASQVFRELVLGRVLVGLGVGAASMVVPTFLAE